MSGLRLPDVHRLQHHGRRAAVLHGADIRITALMRKILYYTTLASARAAVEAISLRRIPSARIACIQSRAHPGEDLRHARPLVGSAARQPRSRTAARVFVVSRSPVRWARLTLSPGSLSWS